jgi:hypothetical protein
MLILIAFVCSFTQYSQYSTRSLLEKKVFYVANGKISSATFWALPLGKFDCTLNRYFPGEDKVDIEASVNFSLLSSGYIEGTGYGTRGVAKAEAQFTIQEGDSLKQVELGEIDYIYDNDKRVKLRKGGEYPLTLSCEVNNLTIRRMKIMIWLYNKKYKELKHSKDVDMVRAFSFTKEGAVRALKAQRSIKK